MYDMNKMLNNTVMIMITCTGLRDTWVLLLANTDVPLSARANYSIIIYKWYKQSENRIKKQWSPWIGLTYP